MSFLDLLFICKQDLKGFQITNDKGKIITDDASILHYLMFMKVLMRFINMLMLILLVLL